MLSTATYGSEGSLAAKHRRIKEVQMSRDFTLSELKSLGRCEEVEEDTKDEGQSSSPFRTPQKVVILKVNLDISYTNNLKKQTLPSENIKYEEIKILWGKNKLTERNLQKGIKESEVQNKINILECLFRNIGTLNVEHLHIQEFMIAGLEQHLEKIRECIGKIEKGETGICPFRRLTIETPTTSNFCSSVIQEVFFRVFSSLSSLEQLDLAINLRQIQRTQKLIDSCIQKIEALEITLQLEKEGTDQPVSIFPVEETVPKKESKCVIRNCKIIPYSTITQELVVLHGLEKYAGELIARVEGSISLPLKIYLRFPAGFEIKAKEIVITANKGKEIDVLLSPLFLNAYGSSPSLVPEFLRAQESKPKNTSVKEIVYKNFILPPVQWGNVVGRKKCENVILVLCKIYPQTEKITLTRVMEFFDARQLTEKHIIKIIYGVASANTCLKTVVLDDKEYSMEEWRKPDKKELAENTTDDPDKESEDAKEFVRIHESLMSSDSEGESE